MIFTFTKENFDLIRKKIPSFFLPRVWNFISNFVSVLFIIYRMRIRSSDFITLIASMGLMTGLDISDLVAWVGSIDLVLGSVDR